jgi:FkbM family methyltransferase
MSIVSSPHQLRKACGSMARRIANLLKYDLVPRLRPPRIEDFLFQTFKDQDRVTYIQVGAHDGTHNDPISAFRRETGWSGLLLEPNPAVFLRLRQSLRSLHEHKPLNYALAEQVGTLPFYIVAEPARCKEPFWADQVSSFHRPHVERMLQRFGHTPEEMSHLVKEIDVPTISFQQLLNQLKAPLDLIFIDAEGADFRLLSAFPFSTMKPKAIVFEYAHLPHSEMSEVLPFLTRHGYSCIRVGEDIFAQLWE